MGILVSRYPPLAEPERKKKSGSYKGPRDGKLSLGNPRGKVSFPLRMPPKGGEAWNKDGILRLQLIKVRNMLAKFNPIPPQQQENS